MSRIYNHEARFAYAGSKKRSPVPTPPQSRSSSNRSCSASILYENSSARAPSTPPDEQIAQCVPLSESPIGSYCLRPPAATPAASSYQAPRSMRSIKRRKTPRMKPSIKGYQAETSSQPAAKKQMAQKPKKEPKFIDEVSGGHCVSCTDGFGCRCQSPRAANQAPSRDSPRKAHHSPSEHAFVATKDPEEQITMLPRRTSTVMSGGSTFSNAPSDDSEGTVSDGLSAAQKHTRTQNEPLTGVGHTTGLSATKRPSSLGSSDVDLFHCPSRSNTDMSLIQRARDLSLSNPRQHSERDTRAACLQQIITSLPRFNSAGSGSQASDIRSNTNLRSSQTINADLRQPISTAFEKPDGAQDLQMVTFQKVPIDTLQKTSIDSEKHMATSKPAEFLQEDDGIDDRELSFIITPDADDEASEEAYKGRQEDPQQSVIRGSLINNLLEKFLSLNPWRNAGILNHAGATASTNPSSTSQESTSWSQSVRGTKRRNDEHEEEGNNEKRGNKRGKQNPPPGVEADDETDSQSLACPYTKHAPEKYSQHSVYTNTHQKKFRHCSSAIIAPESHRLKQHLYRVHSRPEHHCMRCYEEFRSHGLLEAHYRDVPQCETQSCPWPELMTHEEYIAVKKCRNRSIEDLWYDIWDCLFPGEQRPESVYASANDIALEADRFYAEHAYPTLVDLLNGLGITLSREGTICIWSDSRDTWVNVVVEALSNHLNPTNLASASDQPIAQGARPTQGFSAFNNNTSSGTMPGHTVAPMTSLGLPRTPTRPQAMMVQRHPFYTSNTLPVQPPYYPASLAGYQATSIYPPTPQTSHLHGSSGGPTGSENAENEYGFNPSLSNSEVYNPQYNMAMPHDTQTGQYDQQANLVGTQFGPFMNSVQAELHQQVPVGATMMGNAAQTQLALTSMAPHHAGFGDQSLDENRVYERMRRQNDSDTFFGNSQHGAA